MLFDRQIQISNNSYNYFKKHDLGYLILPCGSGKTCITLMINALMNNKTTIFTCQKYNIIDMWIKEMKKFYNSYYIDIKDYLIKPKFNQKNLIKLKLDQENLRNIICNGEKKIIFIHARRLKYLRELLIKHNLIIDFMIIDECHRTIFDYTDILAERRILKKILVDSIYKNLASDDGKLTHLYCNQDEVIKKKLNCMYKFQDIDIFCALDNNKFLKY